MKHQQVQLSGDWSKRSNDFPVVLWLKFLSYKLFVNPCRNGLDANQHLRAKLSSAVSSTLEDVNTSNKDILSCIDCKMFLHIASHLTMYKNQYLMTFISSNFSSFTKTRPRCMCKPRQHARSMPWGTKRIEKWSSPQNCGDHRHCRKMSWRRIYSKYYMNGQNGGIYFIFMFINLLHNKWSRLTDHLVPPQRDDRSVCQA